MEVKTSQTEPAEQSKAATAVPAGPSRIPLLIGSACLVLIVAVVTWSTREQWLAPRSLDEIRLLVERAEWSRADRQLRRYLAAHPADPQATLLVGRVLGAQGKFTECATFLESMPKESVERAEGLLYAGMAWQQARRRRDAERVWSECLGLPHGDLDLPQVQQQCRRQICGLFAMERRRQALWDMTESMLQHSAPAQRYEPLAMRIRFEFEIVDPQIALAELEPAVAQDPNDLITLRAIGLYYLESGQTDKARARLYQCVQDDPSSVLAWEAWLRCLHETADTFGLQEAVRELPAATENSAECWRLRAIAAERAGDLDTAIDAARRAIALRPTEAENHHRLGQYLMRHGQKDEGQAYLTRNTELQDAQQKLRDSYDGFRREFFVASTDQRGELAFGLAQCYEALGNASTAAAWYRVALSENPSHAQSISALERIQSN